MFIPRVQRLMVLGNFHCRGVPLIWFEVVPGVHAVGAEEVVWMFFFFFFFFFFALIYPFSFFCVSGIRLGED